MGLTTATGVSRTARTYIALVTVDKTGIPKVAGTVLAVAALTLCEIALGVNTGDESWSSAHLKYACATAITSLP